MPAEQFSTKSGTSPGAADVMRSKPGGHSILMDPHSSRADFIMKRNETNEELNGTGVIRTDTETVRRRPTLIFIAVTSTVGRSFARSIITRSRINARPRTRITVRPDGFAGSRETLNNAATMGKEERR